MFEIEKIKRLLSHPYTVTSAFFIFFIAVFIHFYYQKASSQIEGANRNYVNGEAATSIADRKVSFNKALDLYLRMEKIYDPRYGNGKLYYDIGNTYFQLNEYGMASLYYYRALSLRPFDTNVENNLNITLGKLGLPAVEGKSALSKVLFFHTLLPLPARLQVFFILALAVVLLISVNIWRATKFVKNGAIICLVLTSISLFSLLYTYFLESPQAVVIQSTSIYRGAGKQFAVVVDSPVRAGSKVAVLEAGQKGEWLKVEDANGVVGYVNSTSIRIVF